MGGVTQSYHYITQNAIDYDGSDDYIVVNDLYVGTPFTYSFYFFKKNSSTYRFFWLEGAVDHYLFVPVSS